jgi:predicted dehydrogenase
MRVLAAFDIVRHRLDADEGPTMKRMPVAVIGAGLIGRTHIDRALKEPDVELVGIADPSDEGRRTAESVNVPWFSDFDRMLTSVKPRGVVVATPNATHARIAVQCLERGSAVLVEKPIADTLDDAKRICEASAAAGLPAIVGHQRRHNPIMRRAKQMIVAGRLGRPVCLTAMSTWFKPAEYFETRWRREKGGGPVLINLIHDIDQLRFLFGDIASVQAMTSNAIRGFEVEDTAVVLLGFRNGALGTVTVSDTAIAPWNWDLSTGEAERFPQQDVNSHFLSGTDASLTLPRLELWLYREGKSWHDELTEERTALHFGDPYAEQMRHFRAVVDREEPPVCSAVDAMRSLEATLAVAEAAESGKPVALS